MQGKRLAVDASERPAFGPRPESLSPPRRFRVVAHASQIITPGGFACPVAGRPPPPAPPRPFSVGLAFCLISISARERKSASFFQSLVVSSKGPWEAVGSRRCAAIPECLVRPILRPAWELGPFLPGGRPAIACSAGLLGRRPRHSPVLLLHLEFSGLRGGWEFDLRHKPTSFG